MGLGEDASDTKIKSSTDDMALITGQNQLSQNLKNLFLILTRKGSNAGVKVTLRSKKCTNLLID